MSNYTSAANVVAQRLEASPELNLAELLNEMSFRFSLTPSEEESLRAASIRLRNELREQKQKR